MLFDGDMTKRTPFLLVPLALLAVSCGGSSETGSDPTAATPQTAATAEDGSSTSPIDTALTTDPPPPPASDLGSCDVTVTGGVDASFSAPGGPSTAYSRYWFTEEELTESGLGIADAPVFQLSCVGPDGLTVLVSSWDETQVPFSAGEVVLAANEVSVTSPDVLAGNDAPVTLTLTQFDDARMVGSFEFTMPATTGAGALNGTVSFDLANPF